MPDRLGSSRGAILVRSLILALLVGTLSLTAVVPDAAAVGRAPSTTTVQAKAKPRPARPGRRLVGRGIVQTVTTKAVVLRRLDGSTVTVAVDGKTKVFVDGRRTTIADVEPGFVAFVVWPAGKPAQELRTFSLPPGYGRPAQPPKSKASRPPSH
jgi:hypothetical protein